TSVYTDFELGRVFWGADEELSDEGSPQVIVYGYDGHPMRPVAPPLADYIPGLEEPQTPPVPQDEDEREPMFIQPYDPDYVLEPMYPEYIPLEDEHVLLAKEQPLPRIDSPTVEPSGYVAESDLEEDPEEYEDDEMEDGLVNYPMDGGDDRDDDDAPADSAIVLPTDEIVSPHEETELVIPPPSTDTTSIRVRITVRLQAAISLPPEAEVERLLAMPTPPPSPLTSLLPPSARSAWLVTAALPSPPLPPPLYIPPSVNLRDDILEIEMPPRKRLWDTWVDPAEAVPEIASMTMGEVNTRVTELAKLHEHDTQDLYALLEDAHDNLRETDRRRQAQTVETLRVMGDMRREMGDMHADWLALQIMAPVTRHGANVAPNNTNPNNMTPEFVQAMIDQALLRNFTNGDGSYSSHEDNQRNVQTARPRFYSDFMKCQSLNFKGTEGVVGLTRWIEKIESIFQISGCVIENQVKFATCTLLDAALTW
nr:reverse transcriptase domain-containing protein [Tanacetum cinerariifolium]